MNVNNMRKEKNFYKSSMCIVYSSSSIFHVRYVNTIGTMLFFFTFMKSRIFKFELGFKIHFFFFFHIFVTLAKRTKKYLLIVKKHETIIARDNLNSILISIFISKIFFFQDIDVLE